MSLKFILLVFTTFLLVQNSFGKSVPVESSENELAPTESKYNNNAYRDLFLKKRELILQSIHDVFEGFETFTEDEGLLEQFVDKVVTKLVRNFTKYAMSLSMREKLLLRKESVEDVVAFLHSLYQSSGNEVLTVKEKKRIYLAHQILNSAYLTYRLAKGNIDKEEFRVMFVDYFKDAIKDYYNSFTKEEQEKKKPYMDWVEKKTVESFLDKEMTDEEQDKRIAEFSQFFELTDVEKFKVLLIYNAKHHVANFTDFVNYYKEQVEKYYDSLPNEKSKLKKKFADHLEKLNNTDNVGKQIKNVIIGMLTLKDDEE